MCSKGGGLGTDLDAVLHLHGGQSTASVDRADEGILTDHLHAHNITPHHKQYQKQLQIHHDPSWLIPSQSQIYKLLSHQPFTLTLLPP